MSNSKNKAVIGAFVLGAVALVVAGVLVLGGGEFLKQKSMGIMYFNESVKGLNVGSSVVFRGVKVGAVKHIAINANLEDWSVQIPVLVEFDDEVWGVEGYEKLDPDKETERAVEKGLRAKLDTQSFVTGQLQVTLDIMPDEAPIFRGKDAPYPEIPTVASDMSKLTQTIKELPLKDAIGQVSGTLLSIQNFVDNPELKEGVHNLNQTILDIRKLVQNVDDSLVGSVTQAIQLAERMIGNIDRNIQPTYDNANKTIENIDKLVVNLDKAIKPLIKKLEGTADSFTATSDAARPALQNAGKALANIESITRKESVERKQFARLLKELSDAARSIKNWAAYLERHPEALVRGKGSPKQRR